MKRDTVKTLAGLAIIGVIVVATFLYGNAQRQSQLKHDQNVKKQQESKAAQPSTAAKPGGSTQTNTAPVQSPGQSTLQGGSAAKAPASTQVAGNQTAIPATGGSAMALPDTGAPVMGLVGVSVLAVMALALRRSKRAVLAAARSNR